MNYIRFLVLILFLSSCQNLTKTPEFKGIEKIELRKNPSGETVIVANVLFDNPNLVGGNFKIDNVDVFIDEKFIGKVNSEIYKVPSKKSFVIPLEVNFNMEFLKQNKGNLLGMLKNLANNTLKIKYLGKIVYVFHGLKIPYSIDHEEEIKIFN